VGFAISVLAGYFSGWQLVKLKIRQLGKLVSDLDAGLSDDKVSENEWQLWWGDLKELLGLK
jgi:hypothetical protein